MAQNSSVGSILECIKCNAPVASYYMPCPTCGHYETTPP